MDVDPPPGDPQDVHPLITPDLLIATCTGDGQPCYANEAWASVFGDGALWSRLPVEDVRFANEYLTDAARGLLVTHQVFLIEQPERDLHVPVLLHFVPVRLPEGGTGRLPVVIAGEVLQEPVSWAAAQTRRRRMEMLGQMAMGIAHDFNNLLTTILGHAELLRDLLPFAPDADEAREHLRTLERAAGDGAALVKKIQQYIRHEKQHRFEPVALHAIAEEVVTLTRPYWYNEPRRQGISITVETDLQPTPPILGWPTELREVLVNLILNAVQAMPVGGRVRLRTYADAARGVVAEVEDTGVGMSERIKARIFEPLFTTKGEGGTGMGLTVSHGIVQEHSGTVEVESEPGRGTLFRLVFPPARARRSRARPAEGPAVPAEAPSGPRPARVLVVDDEPMVRTVTAKLLRLRGHTVEEADGGPEALGLLEHAPFDVLVTDLSMPEMSGRELAFRVRQHRPGIPIILLTGDTDAHEGNEHIDAVVQKPFKLDALEEVIQRLLTGTEGTGDGMQGPPV
jgi:signal transduction histidine kinase